MAPGPFRSRTLPRISCCGSIPTDARSTTSPSITRPTAVAVGDGQVWVVKPLDRNISEVNPRARKQVGTTQVGNGASAVASWARIRLGCERDRLLALEDRSGQRQSGRDHPSKRGSRPALPRAGGGYG